MPTSLKTHHATQLHPRASRHGEGAFWWAARQQLIWVDIPACEVHLYDPTKDEDRMWKVPCEVGFAHPTDRGDLILGTSEGIARLDVRTNTYTPVVNPEADIEGTRFNDGKPGPDGRLFAGSMSYGTREPNASLWIIEKDFNYRHLLDNVTVSNGVCWSRDTHTFYYIDSPTRCIEAFDYDAATGSLDHRRVLMETPPELGVPDGMTIDAEDNLWVAFYRGGIVGCIDTLTGRLIEQITCPCLSVTCPAFGGPDLSTLYFTTSQMGKEKMTPEQAAVAGHLFAAEPGVKGQPQYTFGG